MPTPNATSAPQTQKQTEPIIYGHQLPQDLRNHGYGGNVTCDTHTNKETMTEYRRSHSLPPSP